MTRELKLLSRNIVKFRLYSFLNITSLSIGLASVIYIFLWVFYELGYDKFNANYHNIYRINFETNKGVRWTGSPAPLAPAIIENTSGIEAAVRILRCPAFSFSFGEKMFFEDKGITSDPELFDIFSFKILSGDAKEALNSAESMVVTKSFANRYFGNEDPLNKQLNIEGQGFLTIKAIIEDIPIQSHIQFDYILSYKFAVANHLCGLEWGDPNFQTYIKLNEKTDIENVLSSITKVAINNKLPHIYYGENKFILQPLKDIYLDYEIENSIAETGDKRYVKVFGLVGILILILACINYINLSISLFTKKQKNSSIHKIWGAFRKDIFIQYLSETLLLVFVSLIFAIGLVWFLKPVFNSLVGKEISLSFFDTQFIFFIIILGLFTVVLCGIYPSLLLSKPKANNLFAKFNLKNSKHKSLQLMVGFQNVISILLIICAIGISKQMSFIHNKKLGFKADQIVYVTLRGNISKSIYAVKAKLSGYPGITQISFKDCLPFSIRNNTRGLEWKENGELKNTGKDNYFGSETTSIDTSYFQMLGVEFAMGRNFNENIALDKQNYILNEEAIRQMGLSSPIGTEFALYGRWGTIVGVIKDTYFKSLHKKISPQVFYLFNDLKKESYYSILFLKLTGSEIQKSVGFIEKTWTEFNPGIPFEYHFLDESYESLYKSDRRIGQMINTFSLLAVFIACLGVFGQSTIAAENRIKEIGIRKINGSRVTEVMVMLNKDFAIMVIIAFIIATPIGWYAMHKWLQTFAYKTELNWWIFALSGLLALGIVLLTVSWQSWRAATRNPVEALRYE
jgi:putative ABC transport system permease protein